MNPIRYWCTTVVALGLLLSPLPGAAGSVERSTDDQGVIHISSGGSGNKQKGGEQKSPSDSDTQAATSGGEEPPPGMLPSHQRRSRPGPSAEARERAFKRAHPNFAPSNETQEKKPKPHIPPGGGQGTAEPDS